ncbi:MAG TPA: HAMP domain-containing sensor histidine kinase, partial [Thermoanaerobaculia bacterium]|nr:HAMP domain-containing sensor histidine kinase [Thermoanaerobaculia bacterium]
PQRPRRLGEAASVLAVISHDLRNPLNAILTNSYLLETRLGQEEKPRAWLAAIRRGCDQMRRLLDDLVDLSRIEGGRLTVEVGPLQVGALLGEVGELFAAAARDRSIELKYEAPEDMPPLPADRERLRQVVCELVANAMKGAPAGSAITLRAAHAGEAIRFSVEDAGPGIAAADLPRVFEPFWQAPSRRQGGSGLGLTIARGLVEAHGGRIWVESVEGEGAHACFTIPLRQLAQPG